jgi:hypothetical protein
MYPPAPACSTATIITTLLVVPVVVDVAATTIEDEDDSVVVSIMDKETNIDVGNNLTASAITL